MNERKIGAIGIIAMAILILICWYWMSGPDVTITEGQAIDIADDYLRSLGRRPEDDGYAVKRVEAYLDYADVNHYWSDFGNELPTSYERRYCWIVTFFFDAWHQDCVRLVFVDANTGEVVGGTECF